MIILGKYLSLLLVALLVGFSMLSVQGSSAQTPLPSYIQEPTYPTPSIPDFTVELLGPPSTDSSNGFMNNYSSIKITIKNQPFTSFDSENEGPVSLMYNIRIKIDQGSSEWKDLYYASDGYLAQNNSGTSTELSFIFEGQYGLQYIAGSTIDIQVQAMIGTIHRMIVGGSAPWFFDGQVSGWSKTQTITIPANVPLSIAYPITPTPTCQTPTSIFTPDILLTAVVVSLVVIVALLAVIAYLLVHIWKKKII
jgi:hypothetical protein